MTAITILFLGLAPITETPAMSDSIPIACTLSETAFAERIEEFEDLLSRVEESREIENGRTFRFSGDPGTAGRLFAFVMQERRCCSFLHFELAFHPDDGPIWLTLIGIPEGDFFFTPRVDREAREP